GDIATRPECAIRELRCVSPAEEQAPVEAGRGMRSLFPARTVHAVFEEQASQVPDSIALVFGDRAITYRRLNPQADAVAARLRELGVRPQSLVGLCAERSPETIAGMIGILKAGGTYVPIDPSYPESRIAWMLEDSGCKVILTQRSFARQLAGYDRE